MAGPLVAPVAVGIRLVLDSCRGNFLMTWFVFLTQAATGAHALQSGQSRGRFLVAAFHFYSVYRRAAGQEARPRPIPAQAVEETCIKLPPQTAFKELSWLSKNIHIELTLMISFFWGFPPCFCQCLKKPPTMQHKLLPKLSKWVCLAGPMWWKITCRILRISPSVSRAALACNKIHRSS